MKKMIAAGKFCKKREEDKQISREFWEYTNNLLMSNELLKKYEIARELKNSGLLLTPWEAEEKAQQFSQNLIDCNLMINGLLMPWVLEEIEKFCLERTI